MQIGSENVHRVRVLLDEVFGSSNFCSEITFATTSSAGSPSELRIVPAVTNFLLWYAKNIERHKFRQLYQAKADTRSVDEKYVYLELPDGARRPLTRDERSGIEPIPQGARTYGLSDLTAQTAGETTIFPVILDDREFRPRKGGWKTNKTGMDRLIAANRVAITGNTLSYVRYLTTYGTPLSIWPDVGSGRHREAVRCSDEYTHPLSGASS